MLPKYILALDQGTTSSRAILYDKEANPIFSKNKEFPQYYPQPGWVENNAEEILQSQLEVAKDVIAHAKNELSATTDEIAAIGITNQRETIVVWEKSTG